VGELRELIDRPVVAFNSLMMLDQHHCNVVIFLRVGQIDDRLAAVLNTTG
jgi:hypothetical protein